MALVTGHMPLKYINKKDSLGIMTKEELQGIVHIDLSKKFWEKGKTGIGAINSDKKFSRGLAISHKNKKKLMSLLTYSDSRLYSICIWKIIQQDVKSIDLLVICNDANIKEVEDYLNYLSKKDCPTIKPLFKIREELHKKVKSTAHGIANSYRKKAFSFIKPQGKPLNPIRINYKEICLLLEKLKEFDKKSE